jgi:hypothetical protein
MGRGAFVTDIEAIAEAFRNVLAKAFQKSVVLGATAAQCSSDNKNLLRVS